MKKEFKYILLTFIVMASLSACSREEIHIGVPEGEAAGISLSVKNMDPEIVNATKGMTTPEEQNIESLFILIFNSTGTLVTNHAFTDMSAPLTMGTYSGSGMQLYAVANYTSMASELAAVSTISELNGFIKEGIGNSAENPGHLVLVGNTTMDILADDSNTATINLYYITAKITVKYIDNTTNQDVTFFGWEIFDLPVKSYLLGNNSTDAVNPANSSDFYSITGNHQWEKEEVLGGKHTLSETFYMFENRRGVKAGAVNDYKKKTTYAVDFPKATYFKVSLNCLNRDNGGTYSVVTRIYLGENNYSDFNIRRGKHYTYTVTISGVNSITVDVRTDSNSQSIVLPLSITTSSSMTMDAHPDMRVINIKADDTKISNVSIEVLDNTSWVKVSPLNLTLHQVSQSSPAAALYQQPSPSGAAGYFVRPRFIPHKSFREANSSLAWSEWPTAGADDYDDDEMEFAQATYRMCYKISSLPVYDEDGQAICIYADEYSYVDGTSSRSAKLRIRYDDLQDDGITKYVDYEIVQKQAMPVGVVVDTYDGTTTTYKNAVIEQIEESALILYPNLPNLTQQTRRMQWGYSGSLLYSAKSSPKFDAFRDGSRLTDNAVYTNAADRNSYRTKYASGPFNNPTTTNAYSVSGTIPEPGYVSDNSGAPYYLPNASATPSNNKFYNPIFNTSAARYCHEKNRDLNGDGVIEGSEIQWYLPSQHELYQVWASLEAIRYSTTEFGSGYYWSSSESGTNSAFVIGFQTGYAKGITKSELDKTSGAVNQVVRCIRKTNTSASSIVNPNSIIDLSSMPADAITTQTKGSAASGSQGNNSSSTEKGISENAATAYHRFQVAKADASTSNMIWRKAIGYSEYYSGDYQADSRLNLPAGTFNNVYVNSTIMNGAPANELTGCPAYWEGAIDDPVTGQGHWRLPNKRELFLMWIYLSQLEEDSSFSSMKRNVYYWSSSERSTTNAHAVKFNDGTGDNPAKTTSSYVRCIREL